MNLTHRYGRAAFYLPLTGICLLAAGLRFPGIPWLLGATPYPVFDFHPDVMRLIEPTNNFSEVQGWRGYPLGMTTHLYLIRKGLGLFGLDFNPVVLIRLISLGYGVLTVFLAGIAARALTASREVGLLTALFLALAPLHLINSHFGTADSTLVFFLYVSFVFGWRSLKYGRDLDFVLFVASVGVTLAVKFFIPVLLPFAIVVWHQEQRLEKAFRAALLLAGSFSILSFFNYTPWDLSELLTMIREDNLAVAGGRTPLQQLVVYLRRTPRALGLAVWLFFVAGLLLAGARAWLRRPGLKSLTPGSIYALTRSPVIVPASALGLHFASLVAADYGASRHLLPFVPVMCFVAAMAFSGLSSKLGAHRGIAVSLLLGVFAYQMYNAVGVGAGYTYDIRNELAARVSEAASAEDEVVAFTPYSLVRGARLSTELENVDSRIEAEFFVSCDIAHARYFSSDDADAIFHAYGGQARVEFYRDLFAGRLDYRLLFEVSRRDFTLEQRLATRGIFPGMGLMTPGHCVLYERM